MEVEQHCRIIFKNYFYLVYERYGIPIPDEADWSHPQLPANVPWLIAVEVPRMLMEFGEINEDTRIPAMMELCEYFSGHINESNFLEMYSTTMDILLNSSHNPRFNHDPFLGKMQVFCIFSAAYCIYLYKHNINDWATKEIYKTAQKIFQDRFKFWLDYHHSWEMFLAEGRRVLREKQIGDYQASLVKSVIRKSIVFSVVTGLAILIITTLKKGTGILEELTMSDL